MRRIALLFAICAACGGKAVATAPRDHAAGPPAPSVDAGTPPDDAPPDAGPADAGEADAGVPDAGAPDAGPPDGGPPPSPPADAGTPSTFPLRHSPILDENQKKGSTGWQLDQASPDLGAYADRTSALPGDQVTIHAGAAAATQATWQLWRLGYYGGAGGRKILDGGPVQIPVWAPTVIDRTTGAVSAPWPATFSVIVPSDAVTGVYLVRIATPAGQTYATFVVRERSPAAVILYPVSTNTWQAYNPWGGTSLYANLRSDWPQWHAFAVSFDRPYQDNGVGELFSKDRAFISFAEAQGYDLAYATDADLDREPQLVGRRRMLLIEGHSEYWTANMRDAVDHAVASGTNLAVLAANCGYWRVRFADASQRLLIAYKEFAAQDPDGAHATTLWRNLNRPENALFGSMYGSWLWTDAPATVTDPSSWLWAGAGVTSGTLIPGAYGDESDQRYANGWEPAGVSTIASSTVEDHNAAINAAETVTWTAKSGAQVFSSGSITWGEALSAPRRWDPRLQQLVANVFSKFAGDGTLGPSALAHMELPAGLPQPQYRPGVHVATITRALSRPVAVAAAPNGDAIVVDGDKIVRVSSAGAVTFVAGSFTGYADGPAAQSAFTAPRGVAVAADGTIYVADTGNNVIRAIAGGTVSTLAGSRMGFADGVGAQALFTQPMGLAMTAAGTILVADAWNQRLREVTPAGVVSTWAGNGAEGVADGPGASAVLNFPISVAVLPSGDAVVVSPGTGVLRMVSDAAGHQVSSIAGTVGASGWNDGAAALVSETLSVAALPDGQVAFTDGATARIRALRGGVVDTLAGGKRGGTVDGDGSDAGFTWPRAIAAAPDGSLLVVDAAEHALRRITFPQQGH